MIGGTGAPALSPAVRAIGRGAELVSAVAAGCVAVALLWLPQERLVWQPPRPRRRHAVAPQDADRLDYAAADGQPLLAWVMEPPRAPARGTLVAFHGNAELAAWSVPWAAEAAARSGWRIVLPEYRGYAGLGGVPSHEHSQRDADAAMGAVRAAFGDGGPLALFGHSLGTAVAAELATRLCADGRPPAALLLESPFTSARAMTRFVTPRALDRLWARMARVRFDTAARVAELDVPVAVAHGLLDLVIPARMGLAVHAAAARAGELLVVGRAAHNDVAVRGGERYWRWLTRALTVDADAAGHPAGAGDRRSAAQPERLVL